MKEKHCVEEVSFENNILSLRGWIFCVSGKTYNGVESIQLVVVTTTGKKIARLLPWKERQDVAKAFGLSYNQVGFAFRGKIGNFIKAKIFLEYVIEGKINQMEILECEGVVPDSGMERLSIEYPEIDGYYNMQNFDGIEKRYGTSKCPVGKGVDVIIPVYNGYDYLEKLFASLYGTLVPMRIIVINDCSPDSRVEDFFSRQLALHDNILYVKNDENLGFVKSVNKGFSLAERDVALVNTDVEVPESWLERLMLPIFQDNMIASTTPFTNCGTLCSFPEMGKDNLIYDDKAVDLVDAVFKGIAPKYTEMPTGVGFCMGMNYEAIQKVGFFDESNFAKGYGEENDWCQRAIKAGYKNVQVENLFVYHKHGGSFPSEEKQKLLLQNTKKLVEKHPQYMEDVAIYCEYDDNKSIRKYALYRCLMQIDAPTFLYFNHVLGGGADDYLRRNKADALKKGIKCIEFCYDVHDQNFHIDIDYKDYSLKLCSNQWDELYNGLILCQIDKIFINELVTFPDIYEKLEDIKKLKANYGTEIVMLVHDYYSVCPTINLLADSGEYCGLRCVSCGEKCLEENRFVSDEKYISIEKWNEHWKSFLLNCDSIIVFSDDSKRILEKKYDTMPNIKVVPHITDKMLKVDKKYKLSTSLNIGVLGVLSERKGLNVVRGMLEIIDKKKLDINIVIIGTCEEKIQGNHCIITGKYTRESLPGLMYLFDVDLIFISSVWPETFSYTAEEAMKMDMPLAVFDLGAPAERVRKYDKGLIIENMNSEFALDRLREFGDGYRLEKRSENKNVLFIIEYNSFSSRYRVDHLREHMAMKGFFSSIINLKDFDSIEITKYDAVFIYRCSEVDMVRKIVEEARSKKIKIFYDIDDYIFEYDKIKHLDFLRDEEYLNFEKYSLAIKHCMQMCDIFTTSTKKLAEGIKKSFPEKKVIVYRNAASLEMQLLSEIAIENRHVFNKKSGDVVLGYYSGSKTHNKDWELIEDGVLNIMQENEKVRLLICGCLEISEKFNFFVNRIERIPFVDWQKLPELICRADINLMPLEDTYFQWCKSENKWMEAGLLGVPTIASRNSELEEVMRDGENVIFCDCAEEWGDKLQKLISDETLREKIGQGAREEVYRSHLVNNEYNFEDFMKEIVCQV